MNQETVKLLGEYFSKIQKTGSNNVFRCENLYKDKVYEIFYIDLTEAWIKLSNMEIEEYISSNLKDDYYNHPGYLQWNYYYFFISSDKNIKENRSLKYETEQNDIYARKIVLNSNQFEFWLKQKFELNKVDKIEKSNLENIWVQELKKDGLDFVYQGGNYDHEINSFLSNNSPPLNEGKNLANRKGPTLTIDFLNSIKLQHYRKFPKRKEFNFKNVNLIYGTNGSGKTSLLESIELLFCGSIDRKLRHEESIPLNIQGMVNGKTLINYPISNDELRNRDRTWYKHHSKYGQVKIQARFNKYNFFNSDAAYLLAYGGQKEIRTAIENIAIGESINTLEERIAKFQERFRSSHKKLKDDLERNTKQIKKYNILLHNISKVDFSKSELKSDIFHHSKELNWQGDIMSKASISNLEKDVIESRSSLEKILNLVGGKINNIEDLNFSYIKLNLIQKDIEKLNVEIEKNKKNKKTIKRIENESRAKLEYLKAVSGYYLDKKINQLEGLDDAINKKSLQIKNLKEVKNIWDKINWSFSTEFNLNYTIDEAEKGLISNKQSIQNEIEIIENELRKQEVKFKKIDQIKIDINVLAKNFLYLEKEAKECPLCKAEYSPEELNQIIQSFENKNQMKQKFSKLINERRKQVESFQRLDLNLKNLQKLNSILNLLNLKKSTQLKYIINDIQEEFGDEYIIQMELNSLIDLKNYFQSKSLIEIEFQNIKTQLNNWDITPENYSFIRSKLEKELVKAKVSQEEIESDLKKLENEKRSILEISFNSNENILSENILNDRLNIFSQSIKILADLKKTFDIDSNLDFILMENQLSKLGAIIREHLQIEENKQKNEYQINEVESLIKKLKTENGVLEPRINRAKVALENFEIIQKNYNKSRYLKNFFEKNKNDILEIFKLIHSPKEFEDIFIDSNGVSLKRSDLKEKVTLDQISTGQRNALSLSIFLTLHQKLDHGPEIIIFDDPVTTVDELNILSFMDYLRDLIVKTGKQIFFATADENIFYLFKKKFEFLENDFCEIILDREIEVLNE